MHRFGTLGGVLAAAAVLAMTGAAPASAHVQVQPANAAPGQLQRYSVEVPNELEDQDTIEVDLTLPPGFTLDVAQSVPGWQTLISKRAGVPVGVSWQKGRIAVGTFATFDVQGRNPARSGPLTWRTRQRYQRTSVDWAGTASSVHPAPVVQLTTGGAAAAQDPGSADTTADPLARSRAALGIALGLAALGLMVGRAAVTALRARTAHPDPPLPPAAPVAVHPKAPSAARHSRPLATGGRPEARTPRPAPGRGHG